jgi:hypothetical protein
VSAVAAEYGALRWTFAGVGVRREERIRVLKGGCLGRLAVGREAGSGEGRPQTVLVAVLTSRVLLDVDGHDGERGEQVVVMVVVERGCGGRCGRVVVDGEREAVSEIHFCVFESLFFLKSLVLIVGVERVVYLYILEKNKYFTFTLKFRIRIGSTLNTNL